MLIYECDTQYKNNWCVTKTGRGPNCNISSINKTQFKKKKKKKKKNAMSRLATSAVPAPPSLIGDPAHKGPTTLYDEKGQFAVVLGF